MKLLPAHADSLKRPRISGLTTSHKVTILVAVLGLIGVLGASLIGANAKSNQITEVVQNDRSISTPKPSPSSLEGIKFGEDDLNDIVKKNGMRRHGDGFWYPTRKGEEGYIYLQIAANFTEMSIEFQVINEDGNPSELDPSFIWLLSHLNQVVDSKKQQEISKLYVLEFTTHTRSDGSTTNTLENIGIAINSDLETSISAKRQSSHELPHPAIQNVINNLAITRTATSGNEGIYNFHFDFKERNAKGESIPMTDQFALTLPMPYNPLAETEGMITLNMGTFFGHGLKVVSLRVK